MYAVVRIRGSAERTQKVNDTLNMLNLTRMNHCVVIPENETNKGMLKAVQHYITWGEITPETLEKMVTKRGREGNKKLEIEKAKKVSKAVLEKNSVKGAGIKPVFRLTPPSHGFKSVKRPFPKGAVGYRGEKINDLLARMI